MTEQNSLDKFRSKEVEERFQELISGVVNEEFENMNTALDPQPVGCSKDGTECRIRFIKKDWERNQRMQVHGGAVSGDQLYRGRTGGGRAHHGGGALPAAPAAQPAVRIL